MNEGSVTMTRTHDAASRRRRLRIPLTPARPLSREDLSWVPSFCLGHSCVEFDAAIFPVFLSPLSLLLSLFAEIECLPPMDKKRTMPADLCALLAAPRMPLSRGLVQRAPINEMCRTTMLMT